MNTGLLHWVHYPQKDLRNPQILQAMVRWARLISLSPSSNQVPRLDWRQTANQLRGRSEEAQQSATDFCKTPPSELD
jgi:hypothetical protein